MFTASLLVPVLRRAVGENALLERAWRIPFRPSLPLDIVVVIRKLMDKSRTFEQMKLGGTSVCAHLA